MYGSYVPVFVLVATYIGIHTSMRKALVKPSCLKCSHLSFWDRNSTKHITEYNFGYIFCAVILSAMPVSTFSVLRLQMHIIVRDCLISELENSGPNACMTVSSFAESSTILYLLQFLCSITWFT